MQGFDRYKKNLNAFSKQEVLDIHTKKVCVVGCGGLGGYVMQSLARFGVLHLSVIDGDTFSTTNLNRQLFSAEDAIGRFKVHACKDRLAIINSDATVYAIPEMLTEQNADTLLAGHDLVLDCLDNIPSRRILDAGCRRLGIPYVHGAIGGFYGQVCSIFPGDDMLDSIYPPDSKEHGVEQTLGSPAFIPQAVSAVQCSEALKILTGKGELLRHKLLYIDLLYNDFEIIDL